MSEKVELTSERKEKLIENYNKYRASNDYGNAYRQAVRDTLNFLGIKIDGVNL